jgi:hypothetical protein
MSWYIEYIIILITCETSWYIEYVRLRSWTVWLNYTLAADLQVEEDLDVPSCKSVTV